jgi:hypothetical protein
MLSYDRGNWGQEPSTLAEARDVKDFVRRIGVLGFSQYCVLSCCIGTLTIYTQQTLQKHHPFEYICLFEQACVPLLVKDFPSLIQLLHEVGAQPEELGQVLLRLEKVLKETTAILQAFQVKENQGGQNMYDIQPLPQARAPLPSAGKNKGPLSPRKAQTDL